MEMRISIDDARKECVEVADRLSNYNLRGIFYFAPLEKFCTLNVREMRYIAKYHEVGSHTLHHDILTRIPLSAAIAEIVEGKNVLEEFIQEYVTKFAYPRGYYNPELIEAVANAGFSEARTMHMGVVTLSNHDKFALPVTAQNYPRPEYVNGWAEAARDLFMKAEAHGDSGYFNLVIHTDDIVKRNQWAEIERLFAFLSEKMKPV